MTWTHAAYESVTHFVSDRTGLSFVNRRDSAEAGIDRAAARAGVADPARYLERLQGDADALNDLLAELTVGETYFFREPAQFQFLRRTVLPDLCRRRGPAHTLRAWSAGCASGEEAYSLAMLFEEEGLGEQSQLLATDLSRAALERGRRGVYRTWSLRGEGAASARPHLKPAGDSFRVRERLRRRVTFAPLNLAEDSYPSAASGVWDMDLILCRNVLIYFDAETVRQVARRLLASLAVGGWLITASSDPPLAPAAPFESVVAEEGVFYRRPEPQAPPAGAREDEEEKEQLLSPSSLALDHAPPTPAEPAPVDAEAARVRALATSGAIEAERYCAEVLRRHPLSTELSYLRGLLLMDLGRDEEAVAALRRVLYLDRSLAVAHFALGEALRRQGDRDGARRAYRNARDLSAACPPDQPVPLADGARAGSLAETAAAQLARLDTAEGNP